MNLKHSLQRDVIIMEKTKVICPYCGYKMPITFSKDARCNGIFVKCKGKNCKKEFEIKINKVK